MPAVLRFGEIRLGYSSWGIATSYIRERTLWTAADRVAAVCGSVARDLVSHYGVRPERIRVTYNGVDANLFRPIPDAKVPNLPEAEGKKVVLYVGHFGLRKGLIYLIKAMARVAKEVPDSALVCVGGVPDWLGKGQYWPYLKQIIESNNLEGKVFLLGKVSNSALPLFYSASTVSVLPSYYEAFPKVVIEAMACGRPVVATKDGGPAEAIEDGGARAGLLVSFGSEGELADALTTILQDERLGERMGEVGRKRVVADFTWERVAQRIDSMYGELFN